MPTAKDLAEKCVQGCMHRESAACGACIETAIGNAVETYARTLRDRFEMRAMATESYVRRAYKEAVKVVKEEAAEIVKIEWAY